ncbi:MAG: MaoC/PaaZ C-terminal domain-containing protein [Acinetobacter sp.]|nr:MaoC/PaaZ C-terminal domain-containing protein [Acinetobacter sp.]
MKTVQLTAFPNTFTAYPNVLKHIALAQFNKAKRKNKAKNDTPTLPQLCYQVNDFTVDIRHLGTYLRLCQFNRDDQIPAIYFLVLAQRLQMQMMCADDFPFEMLGLVHIRNHIQQLRPTNPHERFRLSCQFGDIQPHDKGVQFEFVTQVFVDDELVITGKSVYLSRQKKASESTTNSQAPSATSTSDQPDEIIKDSWYLDEGLGRRYALNSGDFNFIHLHAQTAKLFGFKRAIAHGMWSNARALASLNLPTAYECDVQFKLPIFLPSSVELLTAQHGEKLDVLLRARDSHKPHMTMSLQAI